MDRPTQEKIQSLKLAASLPMLIHETLLESPILQVPDEIPRFSLAMPSGPGTPSSGAACTFRCTIWWWRIIRRRWLQTNRLVRVQVTYDPLQCRRDSRLLLIHRRCPLSSSACCSLCIQILRLVVLSLLWLHHPHLLAIGRLCGVRWRGALMVRAVHAIVHVWRLGVRTLGGILIHLHISIRGSLCRLLCLLLCCGSLLRLCSLFA